MFSEDTILFFAERVSAASLPFSCSNLGRSGPLRLLQLWHCHQLSTERTPKFEHFLNKRLVGEYNCPRLADSQGGTHEDPEIRH